MIIECPSCCKDNKISFGENIICCECHKSFSGHSYKKFKKPLISVTTALIVGAFGSYKADQIFFTVDRYPISIEYELINLCTNSSRIIMDRERHINKTKVCICALDKTMQEVSYSDLKKSESMFSTRFRNNIGSCAP